MYVNKELSKLLLSQEEFVVEGTVNKNKVSELARSYNQKLLNLLQQNKKVKSHFFVETEGGLVFKLDVFLQFLNNKSFLPDSYTKYKQKIGLALEGNLDLLTQNRSVVLNWPYKDCTLEGGQTKDDSKRQEIFYNEVLSPKEINRMVEKKALSNFRYFDKGIEQIDFNLSGKENIIIKGNNLIALYSLKNKFAGKIDAIYIDPPYNTPNTSNNTFAYNNTFNHSTWLTFMKNRLELSKQLLKPETGVIMVAIDENEQAYLGVLLDEIFGSDYEKHMITIIHNPRGIQGTNFSYTNEFLYFVFPRGKKLIGNRKLKDEEIDFSPLRNWGGESLRTDGKNTFYPIIVNKNSLEIVGFGDIPDEDYHPKKNEFKDDLVYIFPIDQRGIERKWRYARNTVEGIRHLLKVDVKEKKDKDTNQMNKVFDIQLGKDFGQYKTVWADAKYDSSIHGKQLLAKLVPDSKFSFPKSVYAVYDALYSVVAENKDALILDFFAGSGTTGHAVQMLNNLDNGNRQFILVEQMDYIESVTLQKNVTVQENYNNGKLIYCEITNDAQNFINKIDEAKSRTEIVELFEMIKNSSFISYRINPKKLKSDEFIKLPFDEQKLLLREIIDNNNLYVNYADIEDYNYNFSEKEKELNYQFYGDVK